MAGPSQKKYYHPPLRMSMKASTPTSPPLPDRRFVAAPAVVGGVRGYAGTRIGFALTPGDLPIATFWPPNAILLAALLLAPVRLWWTILLAVIPAHFLAQLPTGVPIATAFGWLLGNAGEALLGAALLS